MEGKAKKQQKVYIAAIVSALHLGKMTAIMSSVLTTLVTNDINTVNRAKSYTDGDISDLSPLVHFAQRAHMHRFLSVVRVSVWIRPKIRLDNNLHLRKY